MAYEPHTASSPTGAIHLSADENALEISGNVTAKPTFTILSIVPGLALAGYLIHYAKSLLSISAILACGALGYSAWCLNSTRRKTVLRLTREDVELTETLLFSTRHIRTRIEGIPIVAVDAIQWEDWREDLLRLRIKGGICTS